MFKRILIANRGEIALRIIRCCREMDIETVIVYSTADKNSRAVMAADKAVCIGPAKAAESYLNQDAIIETAILTGVRQSTLVMVFCPKMLLLQENVRRTTLYL